MTDKFEKFEKAMFHLGISLTRYFIAIAVAWAAFIVVSNIIMFVILIPVSFFLGTNAVRNEQLFNMVGVPAIIIGLVAAAYVGWLAFKAATTLLIARENPFKHWSRNTRILVAIAAVLALIFVFYGSFYDRGDTTPQNPETMNGSV